MFSIKPDDPLLVIWWVTLSPPLETFLAEIKFLQLLCYKSKLLTNLPQTLIGVFYTIVVYI